MSWGSPTRSEARTSARHCRHGFDGKNLFQHARIVRTTFFLIGDFFCTQEGGIMSAGSEGSGNTSQQYGALLRRFGIDPNDPSVQHALDGDGVNPLVLNSDGGQTALQAKIVSTNDLAQLRAWHAPAGAAPPEPLPSDVYFGADSDDDDDVVRLTKIGYEYVFHGRTPSHFDAGIKREIEATFAPFKTAVFAAPNISVRPGSPLIVSGGVPVALVYGEMDIYPGGQVIISAPGSMMIATLKKPTS
jgi:hypothetical protein